VLGPFDPTLVIALGCSLTLAAMVGLLCVAVSSPATRRYKRRLREVAARKGGIVVAGRVAARSLSRRESATPMMDHLARWMPRRDVLKLRLARTGRTISIGQFALATLVILAVMSLVMKIVVGLAVGTSLMIGAFIGIALPHMAIGHMGKRRTARFLGLFPDAIDLMVRALRSGLPISEAIVNASQEIADPVGAEFRTVEAGMRLGRELDTLLWDIAKRIDAPEYKFFIIALSVQRETGGNLAETLANLADMLRRRRTMRQKARAMASEARASTGILGSLPGVVTGILSMTSPTYILTLFNDPRGIILVAIAVGMLVGGIGIMIRMAKFDI
jgi:tight adherence protein B